MFEISASASTVVTLTETANMPGDDQSTTDQRAQVRPLRGHGGGPGHGQAESDQRRAEPRQALSRSELLELDARRVFDRLYNREISDGEFAEIRANLVAFVALLRRWDAEESPGNPAVLQFSDGNQAPDG